MVTTSGAGYRNFYMVGIGHPDQACAAVNSMFNTTDAQALTPLSEETLDFYNIAPEKILISSTVEEATGKVTSNQLGEHGRRSTDGVLHG
jgi:hypothetical protein